MVLTKKTTWICPVIPGYAGNGSIDPFPAPVSVMQGFMEFLNVLIEEEKTDGIQYSTEVGLSIRKWADMETALLFKEYIDKHYFNAFEIPTSEHKFIIEDLED